MQSKTDYQASFTICLSTTADGLATWAARVMPSVSSHRPHGLTMKVLCVLMLPLGGLKKAFPAVWQILRMYYVQDMDELDIVSMLKRAKKRRSNRQGVRHGRNYYGFDPAYADVLCSAGPKEVLAIKKRGEEMVFNYLLELNKDKNEKL